MEKDEDAELACRRRVYAEYAEYAASVRAAQVVRVGDGVLVRWPRGDEQGASHEVASGGNKGETVQRESGNHDEPEGAAAVEEKKKVGGSEIKIEDDEGGPRRRCP